MPDFSFPYLLATPTGRGHLIWQAGRLLTTLENQSRAIHCAFFSTTKLVVLQHHLLLSDIMHASAILRSLPYRLTLFTRPGCSLCDDAKVVLSRVWDRRPFHYDEIDVMAPDQVRWKELYEFDTPVVSPFSIVLLLIYVIYQSTLQPLTHHAGTRRQGG